MTTMGVEAAMGATVVGQKILSVSPFDLACCDNH